MNENEMMIIDEDCIKGMVHEIRGQPVMPDYDLARIYAYETKRLNERVKNNEEGNRGFCEVQNLHLTDSFDVYRKNGGSRKPPYTFAKQGDIHAYDGPSPSTGTGKQQEKKHE